MLRKHFLEYRYSLLMKIIIVLVTVLLSFSSSEAETDIETTSGDIYEQGDTSIDNAVRQWNSYTGLLGDVSGEENVEEKRGSGFYPLRGKKPDSDASGESRMTLLYPLLTQNGETKKAMSFVPVRGRKTTYFVPTRGRKASAFTPMRGKKDQFFQSGHHQDWENSMTKENTHGLSLLSSTRNALGDMELTLQGDYVRNEDQPLSEELEKRGTNFFGSRGKRKIFPFLRTWRLFQKKQLKPESKGSKREALFFASRGKRNFQTP